MDKLSILEAVEAAVEIYNKAPLDQKPGFRYIIVTFLANMNGQFDDDIERQIEW